MSDKLITGFQGHKNKILIVAAALIVLDFLVWFQIFGVAAAQNLEIYFLDVGQGDGSLVVLPEGAQVLIDGGPPGGGVLEELGRVLERGDRYIDLVVVSHPQLDHFGGLVEVLRRYEVGVFVWNGIEGTSAAFEDLEKSIRENGAKEVILTAGDKIVQGESEIKVLSPDRKALAATDLNDTSLVLELKSKNSRTLFTGDIGAAVEAGMPASDVDILKVAHHGSKFSTSANFLEAVRPEAAVIEVGRNSYGHPTSRVLEDLGNIGAKAFRTDSDGTIRFEIDGHRIRIFKKGQN